MVNEPKTPTEATKEYLKKITFRYSAATMRSYRYALAAFSKFMGDRMEHIGSLQPANIEAWVEHSLKKEYALSTSNTYTVCVRGFIKYAIAHRLFTWDAADVPLVEEHLTMMKPMRVRRLPKLPSAKDVDAIRKAARESPLPAPRQIRNLALVETLYSTGCRIDEVVHLRVSDVDLSISEARVIGKGKKERVVFLSPDAVNACSRYWKDRAALRGEPIYREAPAFARHDDGAGKKNFLKRLTTQGARNVIMELAAVAGIEHITPHSFRHFFATKMLEETGQLDIVQEALGHANIETTRIYAKTNPQAVRLAHQQVFGRL